MNALLPLGALVLGSLVAFAQDDSPPQPAPSQDDAAQEKGAQEDADAKPKVTGVVRFEGEVPEAKPLKVSAAQAVGCCPPGENVDATDRALLIDEKKGIANVVVTVQVEGGKVDLPEEPYEMDQRACRFEPHVLVVPKGAKVAFLNSDSTAHNVHLIALLNDPLNQTVPGGERLVREMKEAEAVKVTCDMHTWMTAWVVVTEATHFAVTGADGSFALEGLPAGQHKVTLWHETLGKVEGQVTVKDDGTADPLELTMKPKKKKSRRRRR